MPSVATPEPAASEQRVGVAVVAACELQHPVARVVAARASRTALIAASVPEETSRTCSIGGHTRRRSRSPSSTSASVGAPNVVPLAGGVDDGGDRLGIRVPEDQRPPGHDPVDVAVAVDVLDVRALAARA